MKENTTLKLIHVTFFPSFAAQSLKTEEMTLEDIRDLILKTSAKTKEELPWLKLARFGNKRSKNNSFRYNANVETITGIELDYDAKKVSFEQAVATARDARVRTLLYTSGSYTSATPKWRVLCPTSKELPPAERAKLVARVNGIFGGIFAGESFTLSQAYYFGRVGDNPEHQAVIVDGDFIDRRDDLDAGAIGKAGKSKGDVDDAQYMADIRSGAAYHQSLLALSARRIAGGMAPEDVSKILHELLNQSTAPHDKRWHDSVASIPKLIASAVEKYGQEAERQRRIEQISENIKIGDDITEPVLPEIMTLAEMNDRLVFIGRVGAVVDRHTGRVRKKETAADEYAASRHQYTDDDGKLKKGPALKFWIASRSRITVDVLAWVPGAAQICRPPEPIDGSRTAFNTWRGIAPMDAPQDWQERAKPFLDHVTYLVPDKDERERFLQWLAHIVQRPEVLPHTAYLMITPTTGVGRSLMASIIVRVLRGHVAAGVSLPELLDGTYTGRLSRKLLSIVDEAKEGGGEKRYHRAQKVKSLVTEEFRHINPKYGVQSVEKNCCRWLMFSNHHDAIPFDNSDRRIIVIDNPTERKQPEYYERLFGLLEDASFIGSVRRLLETLDITGFRPGAHAPLNAAKLKTLSAMMSETERAVVAFKEDCTNELTSRTLIRDSVNWAISGTVNENHLTHAITRSGMVNTGRRVKAGNVMHWIIIVKGDWTPESVKEASNEKLIEIALKKS